MKVLPLLLAACAPLTLLAQEGATSPTPAEIAPAPTRQDPAGPPAETPSATQPDSAPLPTKPDPALDLVPMRPGQLTPEPTLTPENPMEARRVRPTPEQTAPRTSKTEVAEQDLMQRIRFREAQTRALADAAVQREWQNSLTARTDLLKREALKRYYKLLFARMARLDPSIGKLIQARQTIAMHKVDQYKLAPTEALDPSESKRRGIIADPFTPDQF